MQNCSRFSVAQMSLCWGWGGSIQPGPVLGSQIARAVSCLALLHVRKVRDVASFFGFVMNDIQEWFLFRLPLKSASCLQAWEALLGRVSCFFNMNCGASFQTCKEILTRMLGKAREASGFLQWLGHT